MFMRGRRSIYLISIGLLIFLAGVFAGASSRLAKQIYTGITISEDGIMCAGAACVSSPEDIALKKIGQSYQIIGGVISIVCEYGEKSILKTFPDVLDGCLGGTMNVTTSDTYVNTVFRFENGRLISIHRHAAWVLDF